MQNIIKKKLLIEPKDFNKVHLTIVNNFLPSKLTPKEIEVLSEFMGLKGDISRDRFGTTGRRIVMDSLGLSHGSLGNHLKNLKDKGFIFLIPNLDNDKKEEKYDIPFVLYPESDIEQTYLFKLKIKGE